ncbi:hypothetical protein [Cloacibacterium sp.]|uniref:hypothetical protein n=1 Tax=Cloacibacterium sp. TaxID=1913682 RepID=UPI0039E6A74F
MYVNYMVPQERKGNISFVFIHGMNLTGKTWETTPDGRMGWNEYFVRKGYPAYWVDQVGAGRSGFNQKSYNNVRSKSIEPDQQPGIIRISDENTVVNFRIGLADNQPIENAKYPVKSLDEFSKQSVPFLAGTVPNPNPTYQNLSTLAKDLKHTVLVSHSQSGAFPVEAALLDTEGLDALILVEPGGTGAGYTEEQLKKLIKIPVLVVFGDNLKNDTGVPGHSWNNYYEGWNTFVNNLNKAGGKAKMLHLPEVGIKGNSHMIMQDTNSFEVADIILKWLNDEKRIF